MLQGFRTINPRQVRKPNNLNAISRECRSVWSEPGRCWGEGERGEEVKEVETPKRNVRNTTWEPRCGSRGVKTVEKQAREARGRRRARRIAKIFGTLNSSYRKRDIGVRRNNPRILCSFREEPPEEPPAIPYRIRDRIVTTAILHLLVLSSVLRALDCSISDIRMALNLAQWRGCNAI